MSDTACQSCGVEKRYVGICHACVDRFAGADGPFPARIVAQVRKWWGETEKSDDRGRASGGLDIRAGSPGGLASVDQMGAGMKAEPIYMHKDALAFLRAWPDVPEELRPVYGRFFDTGLVWIDPNASSDGRTWPGQLRLTPGGSQLKTIVDEQSFNFFTAKQLKGILPSGDCKDPERRLFKDALPGPGCDARPEPATEGLLAMLAVAEAARRDLAHALRWAKCRVTGNEEDLPF